MLGDDVLGNPDRTSLVIGIGCVRELYVRPFDASSPGGSPSRCTARCHLELGISPPPYMEGGKHASAPYIHGGAMDQ